MITKRFLFFFAAAVFITGGLACAVTITQTKNFSGTPNTSGLLTFSQFNTYGGTLALQSIQVLLYLETSGGELILDNDGALPASGTFQFGAVGNLNSTTDVILLNSSFLSIPDKVGAYYSQPFSLSADNGDGLSVYDPTPPDGLSYSGILEAGVKSGSVGNAFWSAGTKGFLGTGTYKINYSIIQWLDYGGIGGIQYAITPVSATGHVTIAYNYSYVPEPTTIILLTVGAFVFLKRKRSK
jgi:hypothetical protein